MAKKRVDRWSSIHPPKPSTHPWLFQPAAYDPPGDNFVGLTGQDRIDAWALIQSDQKFTELVKELANEFGKFGAVYFMVTYSAPSKGEKA